MFLLVGGDSEIGKATVHALQAAGENVVATTRRADQASSERPYLDFTGDLSGWTPPDGVTSACIFVALARLAACAADPAGSAHINVTQTLALVDRLLVRDIHVLFLSTNQVFDGKTAQMPVDALTAPVSEYGKQKARTEAALVAHMARGAPVAILRLAKVVSPEMALVHGWIDALAAGQPIRAFDDMMMAPTPTALVAEAIAALMRDRARGVSHLTGPRDVSYLEVGRYLAGRLGAAPKLVQASSAAASGQPPGATPRHTTLDSSLMRERYGFAVPDAWAVVDAVMAAKRG